MTCPRCLIEHNADARPCVICDDIGQLDGDTFAPSRYELDRDGARIEFTAWDRTGNGNAPTRARRADRKIESVAGAIDTDDHVSRV